MTEMLCVSLHPQKYKADVPKLPGAVMNLVAAEFVIFDVCKCIKSQVGNLRPALTFDMTRIRIFFTQFRVQSQVKTKLHDKQVLNVGCNKKPPSLIVR